MVAQLNAKKQNLKLALTRSDPPGNINFAALMEKKTRRRRGCIARAHTHNVNRSVDARCTVNRGQPSAFHPMFSLSLSHNFTKSIRPPSTWRAVFEVRRGTPFARRNAARARHNLSEATNPLSATFNPRVTTVCRASSLVFSSTYYPPSPCRFPRSHNRERETPSFL